MTCQHCEIEILPDEPALYLGPARGVLCARCAADHLGNNYDPDEIFEDKDLERLASADEEDCCPFCNVPLVGRCIYEDDYEYVCPECDYVSHTD